MKKIIITNVLFFVCAFTHAQNIITGTFTGLATQQIKLVVFDGFGTYTIDSVIVDKKGVFKLSFGKLDYGMAYLAAEDEKTFVVILAVDEDLKLKGEVLAFPERLVITSGQQNQFLAQYASEHPRREQVLSAWDYLDKIYQQDSLFSVQEKLLNSIEQEKQRIKEEDKAFLASLDAKTYVSWFLPLRKLVSAVPTIAQYRTDEIPSTIAAFRNMDYTDLRLYKSGLLSKTIESHFWLIENSGRSLDSVYIEMGISIDRMIENLASDEKKLNEITDYLFKLLERRSLFGASEYLALKVLNEMSCTINNDLASQLESYRAMKIGNIAPDFAFKEDCLAPGYDTVNSPEKLSDIKRNYTLVIFGASWCPHCPQELSQITALYEKWKNKGVEVVFVSLDEDKQILKNFTSIFPFISTCDYQKWDSPVVEAYHVFATPTLFLLNDKREILLKPNSVYQMDAWVDWYLVQGNK